MTEEKPEKRLLKEPRDKPKGQPEEKPRSKSAEKPGNNPKALSNRELKSDVFTAVFSEPENAASLYTALSGEKTAPEDIEIATLEGVLFLARKNDLGFLVKDRVLVISEHQSTVNRNMPLRSILYYGRTMEKLLKNQDLYREKLIPIPTPEFYLFYNGAKPVPRETVLKLSDAYIAKTEEPMLELKVKMININLPVGHKLLGECMPLYEYSWFIERVRRYMEDGMNRDTAVTLAIKDCIREGIFAEFVTKHGTEVENMLFTQFNMDDALAVRYEEGLEDGIEKGLERGLAQGIEQGMERGLAQGMERGEHRLLIRLVCSKLQRGESPEKIAADLLAEEKEIARICEAYLSCGPEESAVYEKLAGDEKGLEREDV